ncbi:MAG: 2-C-methyl-D-erythritol 4-phosphate cytidylyltransferase [Flavipsychrobacter sp.]|jgi:2-C-methyl-D-erythritol 4-phosphate cytidylyltransferase|nr:2-C-methyl-D-erythritol 4-phosphate cytidylyltransferase [Flavipsychrobacter sp.]
MSEIKKYAVIVAGGRGIRMNSDIPKQFLPLLGKPMLCHAIEAFAHAVKDIELILVLPESQVGSAQTVLRSYIGNIDVTTVAGGETRYHSVRNGLKEIKGEGIVFVHDGARPLISEELILRCYEQAIEKGSAIPVIPLAESVRAVDESTSKPLNRDNLRIVQTPQTFRTEVILPAFKQEYTPSFTDEATVLEAFGTAVHLVDGRPDNIKVTTPNDLVVAEALLNARVHEHA